MVGKIYFKKIVICAVILILVLSVAACSNTDNPDQQSFIISESQEITNEVDMMSVSLNNPDLNVSQFEKTLTSQGNLARLACLLDKASDGEAITIGTYGGSITEGMSASTKATSYSTLLTLWFRETYPDIEIELINGGIGATGSIIGASRIETDLLSREPDLVILEFAVNDPMDDLHREAYEGILRRVLLQKNNPAVILMFMTNQNGTNSQANQIIVGKRYDVPMISYHNGVQAAIKDGDLKWSDISPDAVHPNDRGHRLVADLIIHRLQTVREYSKDISRDIPTVPESETRFAEAALCNNKTLQAVSYGAFAKKDGLYTKDSLSHGWVATELGDPLVFETEAKVVTLLFKRMVLKRGATAKVSVDGQEVCLLRSDFKGGFGEYADQKTIINRDETTKVTIKIELVSEEGIPEDSQFILLAVLES